MRGAELTTRAFELLEDVLLARAGVAQQLALAGVVGAVTAAHRALGGALAVCRTQARGCLSVRGGSTGAAEAAGHVGAGVPGPCGRGGGGSHEPPLPPVLPAPPPAAALTAGPAAEQADAPLLAALRPQQLALVAVGGGVRAAHGRHHAGAGALPAHAGGSARVVGTGLAHGAKATQHSSARWGGTGRGGLSPQSSVHTRSRRCSAHGSFMELPSWPRTQGTQARGCSRGLALPSQTLPTAGRPTSHAFPHGGSLGP